MVGAEPVRSCPVGLEFLIVISEGNLFDKIGGAVKPGLSDLAFYDCHHNSQHRSRLIAGSQNGSACHVLWIPAKILPQKEGTQREAQQKVWQSGETLGKKLKKQVHILKRAFPAFFPKGGNLRVAGISAMSTKVEPSHYKAVLGERLRQYRVASDMLCHSMGDLQNASRCSIRHPDGGRKQLPVESPKFKCFRFHSVPLPSVF